MARGFVAWLWVVAAQVPLWAETPVLEAELISPPSPLHHHSSCIVECPNGDLLVCWYRGSGERKADDVQILGSRRRAGERKWSEPFLLADTPGYPDCNPCLFIDRKERLWLFWPTIVDYRWESAILKYRRSSDYQKDGPPVWEWQDVLHITPVGLGEQIERELAKLPPLVVAAVPKFREQVETVRRRMNDPLYQRLGWMPRTKPIQLPDGRWILPLYCDTFSIGIVAIANEDGTQWTTSAPIVGLGAIQPSLARKKDGTIVAFMRENGITRRVRRSESRDSGLSWSAVTETSLPNPGSSVDVVTLSIGTWALAYNDTIQGRHQLAISTSGDEGDTWSSPAHLERWPAGAGKASYPSLIQTRDGFLHVTYSLEQPNIGESIKHARFNEAWLAEQVKGSP